MKEARDRLQQQELEEEQQQLQKADRARIREDQKQAKAQAIEARRKARAEARISRQAEKARETADRAQQRLQQAQKTSQKGKRHNLKGSMKVAPKRELLRRLRVVERPQVLQQLHHHLSHDAAEQSSSQQNIYSYLHQLRPTELNTRKYRVKSYCTWSKSLMFNAGDSVQGGSLRRAPR